MKTLTVILRKPPYGVASAAEALRFALGGAAAGLEVVLLLLDSGVLAALGGQEGEEEMFTSIENSIADCLYMDIRVCADRPSLRAERLEDRDLLDGVEVIDGTEVSGIIMQSDRTMIF